jgi:hypothetical protein
MLPEDKPLTADKPIKKNKRLPAISSKKIFDFIYKGFKKNKKYPIGELADLTKIPVSNLYQNVVRERKWSADSWLSALQKLGYVTADKEKITIYLKKKVTDDVK